MTKEQRTEAINMAFYCMMLTEGKNGKGET